MARKSKEKDESEQTNTNIYKTIDPESLPPPETYRAIVVKEFGPPKVMEMENILKPKPEEGQVLIKIMAAGVNLVDVATREGRDANQLLPYIPGVDCAGIVERVGGFNSRFHLGERVFTTSNVVGGTGCYAEYGLFNDYGVFRLPEHITFPQGASLGIPYFSAFQAMVLQGRITSNDIVLIHNASGAVGSAAVQICQDLNMKNIIVTAGTDDGMDLLENFGLDPERIFNHNTSDYMELVVQQYGSPTLIIECVPDKNLARDLKILERGGRIVIIGTLDNEVMLPVSELAYKNASIMGVTLVDAPPSIFRQTGDYIYEGLKKGAFKPLIAKRFRKLEDSKSSHEQVEKLLENGGTSNGNFVITCQEEHLHVH